MYVTNQRLMSADVLLFFLGRMSYNSVNLFMNDKYFKFKECSIRPQMGLNLSNFTNNYYF